MEKLNYDSLYKFLVSIGLALIALPFIVVGLIYGIEPTLISQEDYEALSQYSKNELLSKENVRCYFESNFRMVLFISVLIGIIILAIGIILWIQAHRLNYRISEEDLEGKVLSNKQMHSNLDDMSEKDVKNLVVKDVEEELNASYTSTDNHEQLKTESNDRSHEEEIIHNQRDERIHQTEVIVNKYLQIENAYFQTLKSELGSEYDLRQNVRLKGKHPFEIDIVAVSRTDIVDRLYEIKYYVNPRAVLNSIHRTLLRNIAARDAYEKSSGRKTEMFVVIISKSESDSIEHEINRLVPHQIMDEFNMIYMSVEELELES